MFRNFIFVLDFDDVNSDEVKTFKKFITQNDGTISGTFKGCTHVLISTSASAESSSKCKSAKMHNIPILTKEFIIDCMNGNALVDINKYYIQIQEEIEEEIIAVDQETVLHDAADIDFIDGWPFSDFNKGQIVISDCDDARSVLKKFDNWDLPQIKLYKGDESGSWDNEKEFSVPRYLFFRSKESSAFDLFELQVQVVDERKKRFRIWRQFGDNVFSKNPSEFKSEFRILNNSIMAEKIFYQWSNEHGQDKKQQTMSKFLHIGSQYLMQWPGRLKDDGVVLNEDVKRLVNLFWNEAQGEVAEHLENDVYSYTLANVTQAEAILMQLKVACLDENTDKIAELSKAFYRVIKHKVEDEISNMRMVAKKMDLCQVIRDILSVSESTFWGKKESIQAKYNALGCSIQRVCDEEDFKIIENEIMTANDTDHEIKVVNIYEVNRPSEKPLGPTKSGPYFHASGPQNFVGILSRGLLLPKIVVKEFGIKRWDAGMLGDGIYFASSPETCVQYSYRSKRSRVRYMLMLQLDLGLTKDFWKFAKHLEGPTPEGYNSTHGVKWTPEKVSDFKDHEYCIYELSRLQITHLIEFVDPVNKEDLQPISQTITAPEITSHQTDEGFHEEDEITALTIDDVESIPDPMSRVIAGLQSTNNKKVPLKAVHIKGKLLDLISEVVILQVYKNESDIPIETKYVFPLDGMAAVCGFQAFINGKHVIGEIKEKEIARKDFKEAVSKGHGAYLMEEQEKLPDIFNVTIGNLPPHGEVLIKVTYVAELPFEGEFISFRLPSNVAPWARDAALEEKLQEDIKRVNVTNEASRDFSLELSIEMPYKIRKLISPTHNLNAKLAEKCAVVSLDKSTVLDDFGFHLLIEMAEIHVPRMFNQIQPTDNEQACMLTFFPEFEMKNKHPLDITFLLDVSNSMEDCEELFKKLVYLTYTKLPNDALVKFMAFGQNYQIFKTSKGYITKKSDISDEEVKQYLNSLKFSKGSTHLWKPLLELYHLSSAHQTKNVFLFSDGYLSDEIATISAIKRETIRMFTFGVSDTANKHCLRKIANLGSGSFEYFDKSFKSKWQKKVYSQIEKCQEPLISDISVQWLQDIEGSEKVLQAPSEISTIFNGSRLVVYGFVPRCKKAVLRASINGIEIETKVYATDMSYKHCWALHKIAAKAIISDWEDGILDSDPTKHETLKHERKKDIILLSLRYNIVTQFTSFIAIEKREDGEVKDVTAPSIEELVSLESVDILCDMDHIKILKTQDLSEDDQMHGTSLLHLDDLKTPSRGAQDIAYKERPRPSQTVYEDRKLDEAPSESFKYIDDKGREIVQAQPIQHELERIAYIDTREDAVAYESQLIEQEIEYAHAIAAQDNYMAQSISESKKCLAPVYDDVVITACQIISSSSSEEEVAEEEPEIEEKNLKRTVFRHFVVEDEEVEKHAYIPAYHMEHGKHVCPEEPEIMVGPCGTISPYITDSEEDLTDAELSDHEKDQVKTKDPSDFNLSYGFKRIENITDDYEGWDTVQETIANIDDDLGRDTGQVIEMVRKRTVVRDTAVEDVEEIDEEITATPYVGIHHESGGASLEDTKRKLTRSGIGPFLQALKEACSNFENFVELTNPTQEVINYLEEQKCPREDGSWDSYDTVGFTINEELIRVWMQLRAFHGKSDFHSIEMVKSFMMTMIMTILNKALYNIDAKSHWSNKILREKITNQEFLKDYPYLRKSVEYLVNNEDCCSETIFNEFVSYDAIVIETWRRLQKDFDL